MRSCCRSVCFQLLMDSKLPPCVGRAWRPFRRVVHCLSPVYQFGWYPNRLVSTSAKVSAEAGKVQSRLLPSLVGLGGGRRHRGLNIQCILYGQEKKFPFSGQHIDHIKPVDKPFDTFFIIKRTTTSNESFHTVSPFLVERAVTAHLGITKSRRKLRSGDLLIEVATRKQAEQIIKLKSLDNIPVAISAHATLNSSKGVVSCGELLNVPIEEILKGFQPQGVTQVQRIKIRKNGQLIDTKHLILTFHSPRIPESVRAGYIKLTVRPYIPNPLRCFKCQRFGHSKASCRGTLTCARCAEAGHDRSNCTESEKCVNCKGSHTSFSRLCSAWKFEKESRTPAPGTSYASAVSQKPETISPRILPTILPSVPFKASYTPSEICPRSIDPVLKLSSINTQIETVSFESKVPERCKDPPDFSDFKAVTYKKKFKKDYQINKDNITTDQVSQNYKPPPLSDKEPSAASNSVTKQNNITVINSGTKSTHVCSVGPVPESMAAFPPEKTKVLQSLESDADAEMSSSSASEGDTLEYDMSEDLEDTPENICPTTLPLPSTARKRYFLIFTSFPTFFKVCSFLL
ncbi:hypothetical protein AVEN_71388-1 [Araneus ventricosus]|uniref:CCHC-type domain-containing protein n=1 Tax=Araneus ventricosus TaxID=182803 RepID=A0A4Y2BHK6_ARAVE|nr:hypothetical protein AVEN_71388-1 [Araneus ventricosus]